MKFKVIIEMVIDPTEYLGAIDSADGAKEIATAIINHQCDLPKDYVIKCQPEKINE